MLRKTLFLLFILGTILAVLLWGQQLINGSRDWAKMTAPANPASGNLRMFANTATGKIECLDSTGASCFAAGSGISSFAAWCSGAVGTGNQWWYGMVPSVVGTSSNACSSGNPASATPFTHSTAGPVQEFPFTAACTAKNLYATATTAGSAASSGIITLTKGYDLTALTCTLGTGTSCSDTSHTVAFSAGDTWGMVYKTGQATDATTDIRAVFQCQ